MIFTGVEFCRYNSFSQVKNDIPMIAGYPVFIARSTGLSGGISFIRKRNIHEISLSTLIPSGITSDDGTGTDFILREKNSMYTRSSLDYYLWYYLLNRDKFCIRYSASSGILHEFRKLSYNTGVTESANDISLYIGPGVNTYYSPFPGWKTELTFIARFHTPWLNYGMKNKIYPESAFSSKTPYRSFIYETDFFLKAGYEFPGRYLFSLVYSKQDLIGYGCEQASFHPGPVIHYKLDRIHRLQILMTIPL